MVLLLSIEAVIIVNSGLDKDYLRHTEKTIQREVFWLEEVDLYLLVLLVLRNQIVHVALSLGELHLVHALSSVPVQEGLGKSPLTTDPIGKQPYLASEHRSELLRNPLEELLDGGRVTDEGGGHLEAPGRDVAHCSLDVVRDPGKQREIRHCNSISEVLSNVKQKYCNCQSFIEPQPQNRTYHSTK